MWPLGPATPSWAWLRTSFSQKCLSESCSCMSHDQKNHCRWPKVSICNSSSKNVAMDNMDLKRRFFVVLFCFLVSRASGESHSKQSENCHIYEAQLTTGKQCLAYLVWGLRRLPGYCLLWEEHSTNRTQLLKQIQMSAVCTSLLTLEVMTIAQ